MRVVLRGWIVLAFALVLSMCAYFAWAQSPTQAPRSAPGFLVVATCGSLTPALRVGSYAAATVNPAGQLCTAP